MTLKIHIPYISSSIIVLGGMLIVFVNFFEIFWVLFYLI